MAKGGEALRFFEAFAWPVPLAFASAVAANRFEQGDVLYRDPKAYGALRKLLPKGLSAIQVLHPPRSARGALVEGDGDRRRSNWESEVRLEIIDLVKGTSEPRSVTQGKLLMALWKGDEDWLDPDRAEPSMPRGARDAHAHLAEARGALTARAKSIRAGSGSWFAMAIDLASDASRAKATLVADHMRAGGRVDVCDFSPLEAGLADPEQYHPALLIRGLVAPGRGTEEIQGVLRGCLYQGGRPASAPPAALADDGEGAEAPDRFSVGRHGLLEAI